MEKSISQMIIIAFIVIISILFFIIYGLSYSSKFDKSSSQKDKKDKENDKKMLSKYNDRDKHALSYLSVVYPMVTKNRWYKLSGEQIYKLYTSLMFYYTPLPIDIGTQQVILPVLDGKPNTKQIKSTFSRRVPILGNYKNISTEAFLSDSQDQVQIAEPVSTDSNFKGNASCNASRLGFAGVMPNDTYYYLL